MNHHAYDHHHHLSSGLGQTIQQYYQDVLVMGSPGDFISIFIDFLFIYIYMIYYSYIYIYTYRSPFTTQGHITVDPQIPGTL